MAYYLITGERMTGIADQARRLGGVTGGLTPAQIQETLEGVSPASDLPVAEEAAFGGGNAAEAYEIQGASLEDIADAIQEKKNTTAIFTPAQMATEIRGIVTGDNLPNAEENYFGSASGSDYEHSIDFRGLTGAGYSWKGTTTTTAGYRFTVVSDFAVYGFEFMNFNDSGTVTKIRLYDDETQEAVISQNVTVTGSGYNSIILSEPVNLVSGKSYSLIMAPASGDEIAYLSAIDKSYVNSKISYVEGIYQKNQYRGWYPQYTDENYTGVISMLMGKPITESVVTEYKIQNETMTVIADEVKRITGASGTLTTAQIITALQGVAVQTA